MRLEDEINHKLKQYEVNLINSILISAMAEESPQTEEELKGYLKALRWVLVVKS